VQEDEFGQMPEEKELIRIASHSPGRLRLRFAEGMPPPDLDQLLRVPAVTEVAYRKLTGSLLIQYDDTLCSQQELLELLRDHFPVFRATEIPEDLYERDLPKNFLSSVMYHYSALTNQTVHRATGGAADLTSLFPLAFFAWAAIDLAIRPSLPRWFELYREGSYLWHFYQNATYRE
jgi:hypothetical protein